MSMHSLGIPDLPMRAFQRTGGPSIKPQGKGDTPKTPNYEALAQQDAQSNLDLARYATQANRVNQYTPWGSITYTNDRQFNQAGYDAAMAAYNQQIANGGGQTRAPLGLTTAMGGGGFGQQLGEFVDPGDAYGRNGMGGVYTAPTMPNIDDYYSLGDNWTQTMQLSPEMQALFNQQNQIQQGLFGAQNAALGRVNETMGTGFDMSGLPSGGSPLNLSSLPGNASVLDMNSLPGYGTVLDPNSLSAMGTVLDINGLPTAGTAFTPTGQQLAMYDPNLATNNATELMMQRINPQMDQQEQALRAQLANQGIVQGTEAYNRAMTQHQQGRNDAYNQAALTGINLGMQQQGLQFNQGLQNRQLLSTEQAQQFGQQNYLRELAAALQAQQFGQSTTNRQMGAAENAQMFGQQTANQQLAAALQAQQFGQSIGAQSQAFSQSEAARQRAFQEQAYARGLPFQELSALTSGTQVQMPQFPGYTQQATTGGANSVGAANAAYQGQLAAANANNAASGNLMGGLFGLGMTAATGGLGGLFGGTAAGNLTGGSLLGATWGPRFGL